MEMEANGLTQDWRLPRKCRAALRQPFHRPQLPTCFKDTGTFIATPLCMKSILLSLGLAACTLSVSAQPKQIPAYKAPALMERLANPDTTYIVNFWATWCAPCIHEMPEFETLQKRFAGTAVKVLLVSLDFKEDLRMKLPAFIERRRGALPEVVWLAETDAEKFIPKIEKRWSGSIPATLLIAGPDRKQLFLERTITAEEIIGMLPASATAPR